jgi:hypothetical protein
MKKKNIKMIENIMKNDNIRINLITLNMISMIGIEFSFLLILNSLEEQEAAIFKDLL